MCAIVDANVVHEVFGPSLPPAGERFFAWINKGRERLVVGGKLLEELERDSDYSQWALQGQLAGTLRIMNPAEVDARTKKIQNEVPIKSNDPHIVALAQLSGARLLYSNDRDLMDDFRDQRLIDKPPGRVYSTDVRTNPEKKFTSTHRKLLGRKDLCQAA